MNLDSNNSHLDIFIGHEARIYAWNCGPMGIISANVDADGQINISNYNNINEFFESTGLKDKCIFSGIGDDLVKAEGEFINKIDELVPEE